MRCKKCNQDKPIDEFYKSKNTKSGYRGSCIECSRAQNADWYEQNKKALAPVRREYSKAHKNEAAERMRQWRAKNLEIAQEYARNAYLARREEILQRSRENHRARGAGYSAWKRARRQTRIEENGGIFTMQELTELFAVFNDACVNPNCDGTDTRLTPDHVVPLARGGPNSIDNIQPLCLTCNLRKGTQTIDYRSL